MYSIHTEALGEDDEDDDGDEIDMSGSDAVTVLQSFIFAISVVVSPPPFKSELSSPTSVSMILR